MSIKLYNGDCLEIMKDIPDGSVDCVICDLPYGSLKQVSADGWKQNNSDVSWDKMIDLDLLFYQYSRILRHNGCLVLFHKEPLTTALKVHRHKDMQLAHTYVWKKDNFSNPYISNVAPLSICENVDVLYKKYESTCSTAYDDYRMKILKLIGLSKKEIIHDCGQGVDHFFRNRTKQFISQESYNKLIDCYGIDKFNEFIPWCELDKIICKCSRTFNIPSGYKYVTDFLNFPKDTNNIHPTQKPIALITHLVQIYSNYGDTILDNCMGSGTTGVACVRTNRSFIGIELNENYFNLAKERIEKEESKMRKILF